MSLSAPLTHGRGFEGGRVFRRSRCDTPAMIFDLCEAGCSIIKGAARDYCGGGVMYSSTARKLVEPSAVVKKNT